MAVTDSIAKGQFRYLETLRRVTHPDVSLTFLRSGNNGYEAIDELPVVETGFAINPEEHKRTRAEFTAVLIGERPELTALGEEAFDNVVAVDIGARRYEFKEAIPPQGLDPATRCWLIKLSTLSTEVPA
jgi:hypothetical protein